MDQASVVAALDDVTNLLRAEGGTLRLVDADPKRARIEIALHLDNDACVSCIIPHALIWDLVNEALARRFPEEFELVLHDPRPVEHG